MVFGFWFFCISVDGWTIFVDPARCVHQLLLKRDAVTLIPRISVPQHMFCAHKAKRRSLAVPLPVHPREPQAEGFFCSSKLRWLETWCPALVTAAGTHVPAGNHVTEGPHVAQRARQPQAPFGTKPVVARSAQSYSRPAPRCMLPACACLGVSNLSD